MVRKITEYTRKKICDRYNEISRIKLVAKEDVFFNVKYLQKGGEG